ncbi:LysR family transcriptional regulator [Oceaniferula spumae]|uniref:LysR family transcriptional regulator n=1 Tax=Oceaniferula spumae TaxID=2979115 RepID=A0AAT9FSQ0_9BACT
MNLEHLRNFIEVAKEMNISTAARKRRLTQPALSRQMAVFENDTGWSLFERGPKSIKLTRDGEVVFRLGQEMLGQVDRIEMQMRREIEGEEIRIAYAPSLAAEILQKAISRYSQLYPQVRVTLADCSSEEMVRGLRHDEYDLILGVVSAEEEFEWTTLRQDQFVLAVPLDHRLAKKRKITPSDLDQQKLLLLSRTDYPGYWTEVSAYFQQQGINAKVAGEFDGLSSLKLGLEAGLGMALVASRSQLGNKIKLKKIDPAPAPICIAAGRRKQRGPEPWVDAFLAELHSAVR